MNTTAKIVTASLAVFTIVVTLALSDSNFINKPVKKVQVAVLMPFSEDFGWWGEAIKNGINIAENNGHGENIEFIYEDTKCDPKEAVSATHSIKARHPNIRLFIVGCDSDIKAMVPLLDPTKDLVFVAGLSGSDLYETNFPIINWAYRLETEALTSATFASSKLKVKTVGVIVDNGTFGGTLASTIGDYFSKQGGRTITERLKYNDRNPETSVLKVMELNPDAIYIQNDIPTITSVLKRLDQLGYKGERLVYYGGRDQSLIDAAGTSAEGVYVPWVIADDSNSERLLFMNAFKAAYNKEPFVTAYFVYDGVMLLDEAEKQCGDDVRCIEKFFYTKKDFSGTLGHVEYREDGNVERGFYIQQIRGGKFVELK